MKKIFTRAVYIFAFFLITQLSGCAWMGYASNGSTSRKISVARIHGTISYKENAELSPTAQAEYSLFCGEEERTDEVLTLSVLLRNKTRPYSFSFETPKHIRQKYSVCFIDARIVDKNEVLYSSDEKTKVLEDGQPLHLTLSKLSENTKSTENKKEKIAGIDMAYLNGKRWNLIKIYDKKVKTYDEEEPYIKFLKDDNGWFLSGSDGCNRLMGNVEGENKGALFGNLATTKMMCEKAAEQANAFVNALSESSSWELDGKILRLFVRGKSALEFQVFTLKD